MLVKYGIPPVIKIPHLKLMLIDNRIFIYYKYKFIHVNSKGMVFG